ncbi:MAG: DUF1499 domain-containing protein [Candidatus Hydrogenedentes bacterium]|nr:DUF1499 domain-containing protein [Candidatus Hydrogenedentota bacterium]
MTTKLVLLLAFAALATLIGGPLGAWFGLLPPLAGAGIFLVSGLLGVAAMIAGAAVAVQHQAYFAAMIGMLGCLPAVAVAAAVLGGLRHPAINDIATDLDDPPALSAAAALPENAGRDLAFPPENAPIIREHYPELAPLRVNQPPETVYRRARSLATARGFSWEITDESLEGLRFEATASTRLFRWKDDIALRIRPNGEGGAIIDMRSKSREGKGDLGANERRIRKFLEALANP